MIAALLAFTLLPPVDNCDGSVLTDLARMEVWTERIVKTGEILNADGSTTEIAVRTFLTLTFPPDAPADVSLTDPDVGGMIAHREASVDFAGNRSCDGEEPTP